MPEGDAYIKVRTTPEFWQEFCVYNYRGDRLRVVLGEPELDRIQRSRRRRHA